MNQMRAFYRKKEGAIEEIKDPSLIKSFLRDKKGLIWLDFLEPTLADFDFLEKTFPFHHLALEDCQKQAQRSKIEEYENHFFMVIHAIEGIREITFKIIEIDIFVGQNYLVSLHRHEFPPFLDLIEACKSKESRFLQKGSDFLLYTLTDRAIDTFFPALEHIDEQIDNLEEEVLAHPSQEIVNKIFRLKKELVFLRKLTGPQREIVNTLTSRDFPNIKIETVVYFRDVYDHLVRIYDMLDSYRDLVTGALDIYLSSVSNNLNEVMRRLTIFAAVFMPITFITGVFGMNFGMMPQVKYETGYLFYLSLVGMALVAAINIWWFRKRKWL